eukprot:6176156-Ditylum_brightwellii.AAC.1
MEHKNANFASAITQGVKNIVNSLRIVLRHQSCTQGCAKANPDRITRVTRIGANASGRTTDRRTSMYITGNSSVPHSQGVGRPKTNDNNHMMSNKGRVD